MILYYTFSDEEKITYIKNISKYLFCFKTNIYYHKSKSFKQKKKKRNKCRVYNLKYDYFFTIINCSTNFILFFYLFKF